MTKINLDEIIGLAEKATGGPWDFSPASDEWKANRAHNANYVRSANPDTVKRMALALKRANAALVEACKYEWARQIQPWDARNEINALLNGEGER